MKKIEVDCRILAVALREAYPRETGMIDIIVDELKNNINEMPDWIVERIKEDAQFHLAIDIRKGTNAQIPNKYYAEQVISLCKERSIQEKAQLNKNQSLVEKALDRLFEEGATLTIPVKPGFGVAIDNTNDMLDTYAELKETGKIDPGYGWGI